MPAKQTSFLSRPANPFQPPPRFLQAEIWTTGHVAQFLSVAPRTVTKWCDSGDLVCYRIPGSEDRRIKRLDVLDFMQRYNMPQAEKLTRAMNWLKIAVGASADSSRILSEECLKVEHLFDLAWHLDGFGPGCVLFDIAGVGLTPALAAVKSIRERYGKFYYLCCLFYDGCSMTRQELLDAGFDQTALATACNQSAIVDLLKPRPLPVEKRQRLPWKLRCKSNGRTEETTRPETVVGTES